MNIKGKFEKIEEVFSEIIKFASENFVNFSINNQNLTSEILFDSIVKINTTAISLKSIDLLGTNIDTVSAEELKKKK